jgi:hypothetical protein
MAVDLTRLAQRNEYDVAIVCTGDTDLIPAIEDLLDGGSGVQVEVAGWRSPHYRQRLSLPDRNLWCHWLDRGDYDSACDNTDYTPPSS